MNCEVSTFFSFPPVLVRLIRTLVLGFALGLLLAVVPVLAQENSTAPIVFDGRKLFVVTESGDFTAQARAESANQILQNNVINADTPVEVEVDETGKIPVIRVDGKYLLSVTSEDALAGRSPQEQAQFWAAELRVAIQQIQRERTPKYLVRAALLSIGCVFLAIALSWGFGWFWHHRLKPWIEREVTDSEEPGNVQQPTSLKFGAQILLTLIRSAIWLYALIYISDLFPQTRQLSRNLTSTVVGSFTSDLFPLGNESYSVLDLLILIGLFVALVMVASAIRRGLRSRVLNFTGLSRSAQETIAIIVNYAFIFVGSIVVLQLWGLDISSLTVFAGVLGVGIGLGLQGIAKEFLSGLVLIFERPVQVGDFVEVGDLMGTVERISVRSTEMRTLDDISIIVPNSRFLESEVINWSHHSPVSRLKVPVGVAYGSNLTTVRAALIDAAKEHPDILTQPTPRVFFKGFGDSSLDFELLVWISEPRKQFQIKSDLYFRLEVILRHRGVEIPFPQRDLHVRSGSLPVEFSPELAQSLTQLADGLAKWLEKQPSVGSQDNQSSNGMPDSGR
ncbi:MULTISPECIES: mechanosensitive ion channel family protein [unclassified Coleofasciculus]|uniref:mechanosensitive ion channel family protein n=1 Tax=unclassified Coleofasciculus TaxID=2692782 RepID=UPI001882C9AC|nr:MULTISPECIES: mechanosensitive ion channel domain-containing protein [unclassified Coleofasciculus]MBE9127015.1 mechanosensitive ion channel [Coleofasciculus sp. LEGE 07081]MBE9149122.1 mechanosensitive ion channel [Coleofasciculus sp. LEGE 07092]